jgi:ankyrin repeat protein
MSECSYDYRFYFSSPKSAQTTKKIAARCVDDEDIAEQLGFLHYLNNETENLDCIHLNAQYLKITLSTGPGEELNHRLIRASKEMGSEFCIVDAFSDQVGRGWTLYLWRGQTVHGKQRAELLNRYQPLEPVRQAIVNQDIQGLNNYLRKGLDVNQLIDGKSLIETAYHYRKLAVFKYLLKNEANIGFPAGGEPSLLLYVVKNAEPEDSEYLQLLVRRGADLTLCDRSGASFLWYVSRVDPSLHRTLVQKKTKLFRPNGAYSSTNPLTSLSEALQHGDQTKIAELFKHCARHKDSWFDIAQRCLTYNYITPVELLIKNGLLQTDDIHQRLMSLITYSLYSQELDGYLKLYQLAVARAVDLSEMADEILNQLLAKKGSEIAIDTLLTKYPKALTLGAFSSAIERKKPTYLNILLRYQVPFDQFQEQYDMPLLHYSIDSLTVEMVELLVSYGIDTGQRHEKKTALSYCIDNENVDIPVKQYLLSKTPNLTVKDVAFLSLKLNDVEGFQKIWQRLKNKSLTDSDGNSLLMDACRGSKFEIVQFLLTQKSNPKIKNKNGETALSIAVTGKDSRLVKLLLDAGANPNGIYAGVSNSEYDYNENEDGNEDTEIRFTEKFGFDSLLEDKFADTLDSALELSKGATCLMYAASNDLDSICKLLIQNGADLWYTDESNQDALTYAILHNKKTTIDLILNTDSAAKIIKERAAELLNIAAMGCNAYAIKRLIDMGASADLAVTDEAISPLMIATILSDRTKRYDAIDALLDAGADLGKTDNQGKTALIYACIENNQRAISQLLKHGGFPNHVNKEAKTAYDHFLAHDVEAIDFTIDRLKPTLKIVTLYKVLIHLREFVLKRVIPIFIALFVTSIFSQSLAMTLFYISSATLAIEVVLKIRKLVRKPGAGAPSMLGLEWAITGKAYETNLKQQESNQSIIESWND